MGSRASTWVVTKAAASADGADQMQCTLKMPAIVAEPVQKTGLMVDMELQSGDVHLLLTLQCAVNGNTGEPLTYYVDRWWSLVKIAIVAPAVSSMASAAADGETDSKIADIKAIANFDVYHREAMEERVSALLSASLCIRQNRSMHGVHWQLCVF